MSTTVTLIILAVITLVMYRAALYLESQSKK